MKHIFGLIGWLLKLPLTIPSFLLGVSRTQLTMIFLLSGFLWVPLAQIQAIADPVGTYLRLGQIGIGAYNLKKDIGSVANEVPAVRYSAQKAKRYHADAWIKNVSLANGTYKPAFHERVGSALMSPFKIIGRMLA